MTSYWLARPVRAVRRIHGALRPRSASAPALSIRNNRYRWQSTAVATSTSTTTLTSRWHAPARPLSAHFLIIPERTLSTWAQAAVQGATAVLIPPAVFAGLMLALWAYKCAMMVVFQHKIIYMPGVPWGARRERIAHYAEACWPVQWREERTKASDGVEIALCVGEYEDDQGANGEEKTSESSQLPVRGHNPSSAPGTRRDRRSSLSADADEAEHVVILYCQGNASSLPPRLFQLSEVLKALRRRSKTDNPNKRPRVRYSIVALSYRGYWTSHSRPSQTGIERDAAAALLWVTQNYASSHSSMHHTPTAAAAAAGRSETPMAAATGPAGTQETPASSGGNVRLMLWGQSIGASVALSAAVQHLRWMAWTATAIVAGPSSAAPKHSPPAVTPTTTTTSTTTAAPSPPLAGLILETPFTSIRDMLVALYPQRWLPYRYLWPFLRSPWDNRAALRELCRLVAPRKHEPDAADALRNLSATADTASVPPSASAAGAASSSAHSGLAFPATTAAFTSSTKLLPLGRPTPSTTPLALTSVPVSPPRILILRAGRDELVPPLHSEELAHLGRQHLGGAPSSGDSIPRPDSDMLRLGEGGRKLGSGVVQLTDVPDALHNEATVRSTGRAALVHFILDLSQSHDEKEGVRSGLGR